MHLSIIDLELPRNPAELRAFVEHVRASIRKDCTESKLAMTRKGYYEEFLDEVEPLCDFAEVAYPADFKVKPVIGNQGFDSIVFDSDGKEFEKIEFAKPYNGAASAKNSRQVVTKGYSEMHICDYKDVLNEYILFFEKTAETKSLKDYSDVTLVFVLSSPPAITGLEADFDNQVEYIKSTISRNKFKAKRVFLLAPNSKLLRIEN